MGHERYKVQFEPIQSTRSRAGAARPGNEAPTTSCISGVCRLVARDHDGTWRKQGTPGRPGTALYGARKRL